MRFSFGTALLQHPYCSFVVGNTQAGSLNVFKRTLSHPAVSGFQQACTSGALQYGVYFGSYLSLSAIAHVYPCREILGHVNDIVLSKSAAVKIHPADDMTSSHVLIDSAPPMAFRTSIPYTLSDLPYSVQVHSDITVTTNPGAAIMVVLKSGADWYSVCIDATFAGELVPCAYISMNTLPSDHWTTRYAVTLSRKSGNMHVPPKSILAYALLPALTTTSESDISLTIRATADSTHIILNKNNGAVSILAYVIQSSINGISVAPLDSPVDVIVAMCHHSDIGIRHESEGALAETETEAHHVAEDCLVNQEIPAPVDALVLNGDPEVQQAVASGKDAAEMSTVAEGTESVQSPPVMHEETHDLDAVAVSGSVEPPPHVTPLDTRGPASIPHAYLASKGVEYGNLHKKAVEIVSIFDLPLRCRANV